MFAISIFEKNGGLKKSTDARQLLADFEATVESFAQDAEARNEVIQSELRELQAEAAAARTLRVKADAVVAAAEAPRGTPVAKQNSDVGRN